jgi:hypothetical protein
MDFTKFVSLLESSSLYFVRADLLGDPFEGSYSRANERERANIPELDDEMRRVYGAQMANLAKTMLGRTYINCWHINRQESAGMWRLYAKTNEAVAVRSTCQKLIDELDASVYVGRVNYIDFEKDFLPEGNTFFPFVHKRRSFEHEQELRAVTVLEMVPPFDPLDPTKPGPAGQTRRVNLDNLIESIYVAPTCQAWFKSLVEQVCQRYMLRKAVHQSALDAEPFY